MAYEYEKNHKALEKNEGQTELFEGESDGIVLAKYKIEVMVGPDRSGLRDFKAMISIHESGKHFHGGGDAGMYLCMDHRLFEKSNTTSPSALPLMKKMEKERTEYGCGAAIPNNHIAGPIAHCQNCGNLIPVEYMTGQVPYFGGIGGLVETVDILFRRLNHNADIYLKHFKFDIRYDLKNTKEEFKKVERARANIEKSIYPLYRILKDTSSGATMASCLRAFLLS
jgi:hypothetical protein